MVPVDRTCNPSVAPYLHSQSNVYGMERSLVNKCHILESAVVLTNRIAEFIIARYVTALVCKALCFLVFELLAPRVGFRWYARTSCDYVQLLFSDQTLCCYLCMYNLPNLL